MDNVYLQEDLSKPYKSYIKRSLGKVVVRIYDPITKEIRDLILKGNPRNQDETCIVDVYSANEDFIFKRYNERHLRSGEIVEFARKPKEPTPEELINSMSEEDMTKILNSKYLAIQNAVNKFTTVPPLFVLKQLAVDLDKSEKIIKLIDAKITTLQAEEYPSAKETED